MRRPRSETLNNFSTTDISAMFRRKRKLAVFYDSLPSALTPEKQENMKKKIARNKNNHCKENDKSTRMTREGNKIVMERKVEKKSSKIE